MGKTLQNPFSQADVKILSEKTCFSGFLQIKQFQIKCRLYQDGWSESFTRELMHRTLGVCVLPCDLRLDKLLMLEQFRVGCQMTNKMVRGL